MGPARRETGERLYRLVLPACVVQDIRQRFPASDGQYCGYQETAEALEELCEIVYIMFKNNKSLKFI
ncbi:hypothetical protein DPEC_G00176400, partial [Dallia pectoralis]